MVKKLKKMAERQSASASGLLDSQLAQSVKESAQQIWLAGMGAFAKAQEEGSKVFESLVKEGMSLQRKTQSAAEERLGDVASKMSAMAEGVTSRAGQQWDKLESIFEQRVSKAMGKLGVPSRQDMDALLERIDTLAAQVNKLSKASKAPTKTATQPTGSVKPSAKRTTSRKSSQG
jgi:poly(hydroxyalkanoate) granule-associated protein